jgi:hypothetical protein
MSGRAALVLAAMAVVLTTSCTLGSGEGTTSIPTNPKSSFTGAAGLEGRLRGGLVGDERCLWIDVSGAPVTIVWPHGYRARFDPARLIGPDGDVVAYEGQELTLGGGWHTTAGSRCSVGARSFFSAGYAALTSPD